MLLTYTLALWLISAKPSPVPAIQIGGWFSIEECYQAGLMAQTRVILPRGYKLRWKCTHAKD